MTEAGGMQVWAGHVWKDVHSSKLCAASFLRLHEATAGSLVCLWKAGASQESPMAVGRSVLLGTNRPTDGLARQAKMDGRMTTKRYRSRKAPQRFPRRFLRERSPWRALPVEQSKETCSIRSDGQVGQECTADPSRPLGGRHRMHRNSEIQICLAIVGGGWLLLRLRRSWCFVGA